MLSTRHWNCCDALSTACVAGQAHLSGAIFPSRLPCHNFAARPLLTQSEAPLKRSAQQNTTQTRRN